MAVDLKGIRVFVASPGGLNEERIEFAKILEQLNRDWAQDAGFTLIPIGWEYVSAGIGRPQELINESIRGCDYIIVVLWDKWGTPPGGGNSYTSGTEEEYYVALECLEDPERPMRNVLVLFKGVQDRQMSDPGPELKQVLSFKKKLEVEHHLLFDSFDTIDEFRNKVRTRTHTWLRDWASDDLPPKTAAPSRASSPEDRLPVDDSSESTPNDEKSLIEQALTAAARKRFTEAQELFARATTGQYDREALTEYVRFLRKIGRLRLADQTAERLRDEAREAADLVGEIEGISNMALVARLEGRRDASLRLWDQAVSTASALVTEATESGTTAQLEAAKSTQAFLLDNRALTLRRIPNRIDEAIADLESALTIRETLDDPRGRAHTLRNLGVMNMQIGNTPSASRQLNEANKLFEAEGYVRGVAATLGAIAELREFEGDFRLALAAADSARAINSDHQNRVGLSMNYSLLSRLYIHEGNLPRAREMAEACMRINEEVGSREGIATGLHALGKVQLAEASLLDASASLNEAFATFSDVDNQAGRIGTLIDLGWLALANSDLDRAVKVAIEIDRMLSSDPHASLLRQLTLLVEAIPQN